MYLLEQTSELVAFYPPRPGKKIFENFFLENVHIPVFCGGEHEKRVILAVWGRKKVEISDLKHVFSWVFRGVSLSRTLFSASNGSNDSIETTFPSKPGVEN